MNVYLDAQPLLGARTGISRYVQCLYKNLREQPDIGVLLAFNRIGKSIDINKLPLNVSKKNVVNSRYPFKVIRRLFQPNVTYNLPYDLLKREKADIFHGTNFTHMPVTRGKTVVTIHDLAYMQYPETTSEKILKHHSRWVPYSAKHCDRIIAISHQTKRDIVSRLHVPPDKIDVIHLAAAEDFIPLPAERILPVLRRHSLPERYILFVGTIEPRKNLIGLLQAFHVLKTNSKITEKLVIVGVKGWKYSPIFEWVENHRLADDIIFTGYVDDQELAAIYNGATVFVMPSIYEGFGLPILEAMSCGTPVIGSNVSAIPEIIGDSGRMVSPHDPEQLAQEMHALIEDESLRKHYSLLSLKRASEFSWDKVAKATYDVYRKVL